MGVHTIEIINLYSISRFRFHPKKEFKSSPGNGIGHDEVENLWTVSMIKKFLSTPGFWSWPNAGLKNYLYQLMDNLE